MIFIKTPTAILPIFCCALIPLRAPAFAPTSYDGAMPEDKVKPPTAAQRWVFATPGGHLAFVPYGPKVIRVTFMTGPDTLIPSRWGTIASPSGDTSWTVANYTLTSSAMVLKLTKPAVRSPRRGRRDV